MATVSDREAPVGAERPHRWPSGTARLLVLSLGFHGSFCILIATLPQQLLRVGYGTFAIGVVIGNFGMGAIGARLLLGRRLNSWRLGAIFRTATGLLITAMVGYLLARDAVTISLARMLHGASFALFGTAVSLWIANNARPDQRGALRGIEGAAAGLCVALAPSLGLWLAATLGFPAVPVAGLALASVAILLPITGHQRSSDRPSIAGAARAWPAFVALLGAGALLGALQTFMPLIPPWKGAIPLAPLLIAFGVALVVGRLGGGIVADRLGRQAVIRAGALVLAVSLALFYLGTALPTLFAACALFGLGVGAFTTSVMTAIIDLTCDRPDQAQILAMSGLSWEVGVALGPMIFGLFGTDGNVAAIFRGIAACGVGLSGWSFLLKRMSAAPRRVDRGQR